MSVPRKIESKYVQHVLGTTPQQRKVIIEIIEAEVVATTETEK